MSPGDIDFVLVKSDRKLGNEEGEACWGVGDGGKGPDLTLSLTCLLQPHVSQRATKTLLYVDGSFILEFDFNKAIRLLSLK